VTMFGFFRKLFQPPEVGRSGKWARVRAEHLARQPECQACGKRSGDMEVHHISPYAENPERELSPDNLWTLCADPCHLVHGHLMNFKRHDKDVVANCRAYRQRLAEAKKQCEH